MKALDLIIIFGYLIGNRSIWDLGWSQAEDDERLFSWRPISALVGRGFFYRGLPRLRRITFISVPG